MTRPQPASRLAPTLLGLFLGGVLGLPVGLFFMRWTIGGMGAAQGFADNDGLAVVLMLLVSLAVLAGGLIGGIAGYKLAGTDEGQLAGNLPPAGTLPPRRP